MKLAEQKKLGQLQQNRFKTKQDIPLGISIFYLNIYSKTLILNNKVLKYK